MQIFFVKVINNFTVLNYSIPWSLVFHMLVTCDPSNDNTNIKRKNHISK